MCIKTHLIKLGKQIAAKKTDKLFATRGELEQAVEDARDECKQGPFNTALQKLIKEKVTKVKDGKFLPIKPKASGPLKKKAKKRIHVPPTLGDKLAKCLSYFNENVTNFQSHRENQTLYSPSTDDWKWLEDRKNVYRHLGTRSMWEYATWKAKETGKSPHEEYLKICMNRADCQSLPVLDASGNKFKKYTVKDFVNSSNQQAFFRAIPAPPQPPAQGQKAQAPAQGQNKNK